MLWESLGKMSRMSQKKRIQSLQISRTRYHQVQENQNGTLDIKANFKYATLKTILSISLGKRQKVFM